MPLFEYEVSLIYISPEEKRKGCYEFYTMGFIKQNTIKLSIKMTV